MTSLSDRNMSLGDVLLPQGGKQRCLCPRAQGLFTLRKVILMQLSVALSLHFGWGSQLNTSEMFWIDISRWMISSTCRWISVYLPWRTAHALNLNQSCNIVSSHNPVNCPAVICLPRIVSGETVLHEHLWDRSPFVCPVRGRRVHKEQIGATHTRKHTEILPSFGPHGCVKPYCCLACIGLESSGA